jgi:hypothetical protein
MSRSLRPPVHQPPASQASATSAVATPAAAAPAAAGWHKSPAPGARLWHFFPDDGGGPVSLCGEVFPRGSSGPTERRPDDLRGNCAMCRKMKAWRKEAGR